MSSPDDESSASASASASVSEDAVFGADEEQPQGTRSHGGKRNTQNFGDKLACCEISKIHTFLSRMRCFCGNDCLLKLFSKGDTGNQIVYDLREERFSGETAPPLQFLVTARSRLARDPSVTGSS